MKDFFKNMLKTPMALVFVFISIFYGVPALADVAEVNKYAIITAIGLDPGESQDEIKLSLLTFTPVAEQTYTEKYKVVTSTGRSISEALDYAGLNIGREIGLSHVKNVIMNKKLVEKDMTKYLDYLSRNQTFQLSCKLIITETDASEFLGAVKNLDSESSVKISEIMTYNKDYIYATDTTFETFFKGLFSPTKVSVIPVVTLSTEGDGIEIGGGSGGGSGGGEGVQSEASMGGSGGGGGQDSKRITNDGKTAVLKDGKLKMILDGLDIKKINIIKGVYTTGSLVVEDFSDETFKDAELTFEILGRQSSYKIVYENEIPVVMINTKMIMTLAEVESPSGLIEENVEYLKISPKLIDAIELKVKSLVSQGIDIMRENQTDIVNFYTMMYNSNKTAFLNFLNNLEDKDDYLNKVIFKVGVQVFTR